MLCSGASTLFYPPLPGLALGELLWYPPGVTPFFLNSPMKYSLFSLAIAVAFSAAAPLLHAQGSLLSEAQRAFVAGDHATAKSKFELVLASDPGNKVAANYLRMIAAQEQAGGGRAKVQRDLKGVILPKVSFNQATLADALEYLRQQAKSVGGVQTSFVLQPGVDGSLPITLSLEQIPFTEVLRYIGDLAQVRFDIDQYAISVRPRGGAGGGGGSEATPQ